jgi:hypothetical protein
MRKLSWQSLLTAKYQGVSERLAKLHARLIVTAYACRIHCFNVRQREGLRFFLGTSCKMLLSSVRSATGRLSLRLSSSSCRSRRTSLVPSSQYFFFPNVEARLRNTHAVANIFNCGARLFLAKTVGVLLFRKFLSFLRSLYLLN